MSFRIEELSGILSINNIHPFYEPLQISGPRIIIGGLSYAIFNAEASVK